MTQQTPHPYAYWKELVRDGKTNLWFQHWLAENGVSETDERTWFWLNS